MTKEAIIINELINEYKNDRLYLLRKPFINWLYIHYFNN